MLAVVGEERAAKRAAAEYGGIASNCDLSSEKCEAVKVGPEAAGGCPQGAAPSAAEGMEVDVDVDGSSERSNSEVEVELEPNAEAGPLERDNIETDGMDVEAESPERKSKA